MVAMGPGEGAKSNAWGKTESLFRNAFSKDYRVTLTGEDCGRGGKSGKKIGKRDNEEPRKRTRGKNHPSFP